jgi:hypothetical protein
MPAACPRTRKKKVTDRAQRYRANQKVCRPEGPKRCGFCGSNRFVVPHHINGREEDTRPGNLMWACKSCNTRLGSIFARLKIGRRTKQFNPGRKAGAQSWGQWLTAVLSAKGESQAMAVSAAVKMIRETPKARRSRFQEEIWAWRRKVGLAKRRGRDSEVPF